MSSLQELLMAYADGEFDAEDCGAERAAVAAAVAADPQLADVIEGHRSMRAQLAALHAGALTEPVPDRLVAAVRAGPVAAAVSNVRFIDEARAASQGAAAGRPRWSARLPRSWQAMAASLVIGITAGYLAVSVRDAAPLAQSNGRLIARGTLARALTEQLASTQPPDAAIQIGLTVKARSGVYCRTFEWRQAAALDGIACRNGSDWQVRSITGSRATAGESQNYQPAGSAMAPALRADVAELIVGAAFDARAETQARDRQWQP